MCVRKRERRKRERDGGERDSLLLDLGIHLLLDHMDGIQSLQGQGQLMEVRALGTWFSKDSWQNFEELSTLPFALGSFLNRYLFVG